MFKQLRVTMGMPEGMNDSNDWRQKRLDGTDACIPARILSILTPKKSTSLALYCLQTTNYAIWLRFTPITWQ